MIDTPCGTFQSVILTTENLQSPMNSTVQFALPRIFYCQINPRIDRFHSHSLSIQQSLISSEPLLSLHFGVNIPLLLVILPLICCAIYYYQQQNVFISIKREFKSSNIRVTNIQNAIFKFVFINEISLKTCRWANKLLIHMSALLLHISGMNKHLKCPIKNEEFTLSSDFY